MKVLHTRRHGPARTETTDRARQLALFALASVLAFAAYMVLIGSLGEARLEPVLHRAAPIWLAACFGAQVVAYLGYVLAVRDVARVDGGARLGFALTARTVLAGFGVYAATHAAGGFAVDYWTLRRAGLSRHDAVRRVLGLGALEYAILAPAALVCAVLLLLGEGGHVRDAMTVPWLLVVPGMALALWVSSPARAARFSDPTSGGRVQRWLAHAVAGVVTLRILLRSPLRHSGALVGVSLYWVGDIACLWAALQLASVDLAVPALVVAYATGYVLSRRSLPAGGAGFVEVLMTFALVWVGVPLAPAVLAVVVYRLFNFWLPIVPALAVLPAVKELRASYAGEGRSGAGGVDETGPAVPASGTSRVAVALKETKTTSPGASAIRSAEARVTSATTGPTRTRARFPSRTTEATDPRRWLSAESFASSREIDTSHGWTTTPTRPSPGSDE